MKNSTKYSFYALIVLALFFIGFFASGSASAQQLKVSTGANGGTYSTMFKQIVQRCGTSLILNEVNSTGSVENINRLAGNEVNAAFTQSDVLFLRSRTEDLGNIKTLLALAPEQVHLVAPADSGIKRDGEGITGRFNKVPVTFTSLNDLGGYRVGAYGGSFVTAQVIKLQSDVPYEVVDTENEAATLAALTSGSIQAAIFVGGQPLGVIAKLPKSFKLLRIDGAAVDKLKNVYKVSRLNYNNLGAAGVPTVATDALFVTRSYKTEKMVTGLSTLRGCVTSQLDDIKETTGSHPAWQQVSADNKGLWPYYELPVAAPVPLDPAPAPAVTKKK